MTTNRPAVILLLSLVFVTVSAFAPAENPTSSSRLKKWSTSSSYAPMKRVGFAGPPSSLYRPNQGFVHKMSSDAEAEAAKLREQAKKLREEAAEAAGMSVEELQAATKSGGTIYDDEVPEEREETLSSSMRERLVREASTGMDSNEKQTNVLVYISIAVAVLVILGGSGTLY